MSKNNENKLVPRLRFPEFLNEGEWETDKVNNLFGLQDGYPFASSDFSGIDKETKQVVRITDINNQNKNGDKVYVSINRIKELDIEKYGVTKGDLLLSLTGAAGFNFFIWNSDDAYLNQRTMKIYPKSQENKALSVLLEPLIHSKINAIGTGQNNNLSKDSLKEIEILFPKPKEQQKIASCLSSLDDLITAESQKLEVLKEHKKGLLQNLFPKPSESEFSGLKDEQDENKKFGKSSNSVNPDSDNVPKLRFKEFEGSGEWVEKTLQQICKMQAGKFVSASEIKGNYNEGLFPCYGGNGLRGYTKSNTHSGRYSLIGRQGALCGNVTLADGIFHATEHAVVVTPEKNVDTVWLYYLLGYLNLNQYATGQAQPGLSVTNLEQIKTKIPTIIEEQQRIASCLSSIDELIIAQGQKIEELQLHKKGLLQGLFPNLNEGNDG